MKKSFFIFFCITLSTFGTSVHAQPNAASGTVHDYSELEEPFVPHDSCRLNRIILHVLDENMQAYSGVRIRVEYKDFTSHVWKLYEGIEATLPYNEGKEELTLLISGLPNGYYRVWGQCLRTDKTGWVPMLLDTTPEEDPLAIRQYTLQIAQRQHWLPQEAPPSAKATTAAKHRPRKP